MSVYQESYPEYPKVPPHFQRSKMIPGSPYPCGILHENMRSKDENGNLLTVVLEETYYPGELNKIAHGTISLIGDEVRFNLLSGEQVYEWGALYLNNIQPPLKFYKPIQIGKELMYVPATVVYEAPKTEEAAPIQEEPYIVIPQEDNPLLIKVDPTTRSCIVPVEYLRSEWDPNELLKKGYKTEEVELYPGRKVYGMVGLINVNLTDKCVQIFNKKLEVVQSIPYDQIDGSMIVFVQHEVDGKNNFLKGTLKKEKKQPQKIQNSPISFNHAFIVP